MLSGANTLRSESNGSEEIRTSCKDEQGKLIGRNHRSCMCGAIFEKLYQIATRLPLHDRILGASGGRDKGWRKYIRWPQILSAPCGRFEI